jgi:hypothetical protein
MPRSWPYHHRAVCGLEIGLRWAFFEVVALRCRSAIGNHDAPHGRTKVYTGVGEAVAKAQDTDPSRLALCTMLARENHMAGVLLERIVYWIRYGRAEIPRTMGCWIANERTWWMREARLSLDQYDRSIRRLKEWQLVEARQFWWGRRSILHVRPTKLTIDYLAAAKTWKAADEFIADVLFSKTVNQGSAKTLSEPDGKSAKPGSAKTLISNADGKSAKPGSANTLNPNNIINVHLNPQGNDTSAPASPTCACQADLSKKSEQEEITVKNLCEMWETTAEKFHADEIAAGKFAGKLTPKDKGCIAKFYAALASPNDYSDWQPTDVGVLNIIAFCISNWGAFSSHKYPYPQASYLNDYTDLVVNGWIKAGKPKHETAFPTAFGCEYKKS